MGKLWHSCIVIGCAVIFFTKGFLLIKLEIGQKSPSCPSHSSHYRNTSSSCWSLPSRGFHYKKLVILIIDALRYDFAFYQDYVETKLPFHNNMPIFRDLIRDGGCKKARLWRFKADAPTTTMQRLKGLTTGSLPTFIDVSKNFASSEITEDNFLDQFIKSDMNITFMGDDTWMGLFPGRFNKAYPYPSFDVKDLHLVDNGVIEHLLPEIAEKDWQLLIAHFLGVDHCGHRYGPYHPEMPLKLRQMNDVVADVVNAVDDDTLLLVMGDHGMTPTGDHGGETFNEVSATLFAYSPAGAFQDCTEPKSEDYEVVNQVDIVPTISLLLGTAVPFANLGIVIKEMLQQTDDVTDTNNYLLDALDVNMKQMHTYIKMYQEVTKSLPKDLYENFNLEVENLDEMRKSPEQFSIKEMEKKFKIVMHSARNMCQLVWAKFDVGLMVSGLSLLFLWLYVLYNIQIKQTFGLINTTTLLSAFLLILCVVLPYIIIIGNEAIVFLMSWIPFVIFTCFAIYLLPHFCIIQPNFSQLVSVFFLVAYSVSFTSNSFILNEDCTVMYFFSSSLVLISFFNFSDTESKSKSHNTLSKQTVSKQTVNHKLLDQTRLWEFVKNIGVDFFKNANRNITACMCVIAAMFCTRVSFSFRCCRAEQFWCFDDNNASVAESDPSYFIRTVISCVCLPSCVCVGIRTTKSPISTATSVWDKIICAATACCVIHWIILLMPSKMMEELPGWLVTLFPRFVFALLITYLLLDQLHPVIGFTNSIVVVKKANETENLKEKVVTNDTFGFTASGIEAFVALSLFRLVLCLIILFSLLLGSQLATAMSLWMVTAYCVLELFPIKSRRFVGLDVVIVWNLLCSFWWFSTCHQASLSSIRWDAAFVGFQGNHVTNVIPALLLVLDTFSMQILSSVSLPLLLLWKTKSPIFSTHDGITCFDTALNDVFLKHLCFHVIKIIGCMLAALMHKRHLMVWWIFAPRFLFEVISIVVVMLSSLFTFVYLKMVLKRAQKVFKNSI